MAAATIRPAQLSDRDAVIEMRLLLWPDCSREKEGPQFEALVGNGMSGTLPAAILVAQGGDGVLAGFVEVGLRSHADGCDTARPVGFVEGWFVREPFRGQEIGGELMRAAEEWARAHGCLEMASDALIDNRPSEDAHRALGFEVVDRCVHLRKAL
ncbi:MAG: GNAT family N-acetyltransferase [Acidobacteriaceae bacterium]|jgi:aminoglycoside 6'-N-acetyltransferase I